MGEVGDSGQVTVAAFRWLVVLSTLLPFVGPVADHYLLPALSLPRSAWQVPEWSSVLVGVATANLVLGLVSTVGLCLFKCWSRVTTVVGTVVGLLVYPWASYFLLTGVKEATDALALLMDGMVIALAFWSPLAGRFDGSVAR